MAIDDEQRRRISGAIDKYIKKNEPKTSFDTRKNGAPEKDLEQVVMPWLKTNGFSVNVIESKATYDLKAGRYIGQSVKQGFVDIAGNYKTGLGVFIELKAPGKRSTLRPAQREFLLDKIETGCFAVCIDSLMLLKNQFERFMLHQKHGQYQLAKDFLKAALPADRKVQDDGKPLFPEE